MFKIQDLSFTFPKLGGEYVVSLQVQSQVSSYGYQSRISFRKYFLDDLSCKDILTFGKNLAYCNNQSPISLALSATIWWSWCFRNYFAYSNMDWCCRTGMQNSFFCWKWIQWCLNFFKCSSLGLWYQLCYEQNS